MKLYRTLKSSGHIGCECVLCVLWGFFVCLYVFCLQVCMCVFVVGFVCLFVVFCSFLWVVVLSLILKCLESIPFDFFNINFKIINHWYFKICI